MIRKDRLEELMSRETISFTALSASSGIPEATLKAYLNGNLKDIPSDRLAGIADVLECSMDYLYGRSDSPDAADQVALRNGLQRYLIENIKNGSPVGCLIAPNVQKCTKHGKQWMPIAVWPYNLIEVLRTNGCPDELKDFYSDFTVPISEDQEEGLEKALENLTSEEKESIIMIFKEGFTLDETAAKLDRKLSTERVRQIEAKALRKLRHPSRWNLIKMGYKACMYNNEKEKLDNAGKELEKKKKDLEFLDSLLAKKEKELEKRVERAGLSGKDLTDFKKLMEMHSISRASPIDEMNLSTRTYNCLRRASILTVGDLIDFIRQYKYKWVNIRQFGEQSQKEVAEKLQIITGMSIDEIMEGGNKNT